MAWTNITPNPKGGAATSGGASSGVYDYWNYRTMAGNVEARLLDVTFASGYQFTDFFMTLQLVTSSGGVLASKTLGKKWGVPPGFTFMGILAGQSVRFRVNGTTYYPANASGQWYEFTLQMRYGG